MDEKTVCSELTEERKQEILVRLQERGVPQACPMCKGKNWTLMEGYFNHPLQTQLGKLVLGKSVPSVVIICLHCGYISQHALGTLKLLPPPKTVAGAQGERT
ncbi:MAG: hypothetical protein FWH21_01590 [Kiritimatiellaeota bacterium]|nr:hypothetical protein [Kiritimatiellota bacterium]